MDEVDEHLQIPDLGLELIHQLLLHPSWIHYLSNGSVHSLSQLLGRQVPDVLVQINIQLFDQLVNDDLENVRQNDG